ncbi:MAG TPA: flagellar export chaperone FlgN [Rectinemataceae bacterium]|nr:flagellar export chaperone FlgN [Rectinemataceae bacterium]
MNATFFADLVAAIEGEIAGFEACVAIQKDFEKAIEARNWPALENAMACLDEGLAEIGRLEERRASAEALFRASIGAPGAGIPGLLFHVTEPARSQLSDLHRRLRVAAMRVRLENASIGEYARSSRDLLGEVLRELFPEKKGKIYGRSGRAVEPGHDAILLNTAM